MNCSGPSFDFQYSALAANHAAVLNQVMYHVCIYSCVNLQGLGSVLNIRLFKLASF